MSAVTALTTASFKEFIASSTTPVLVDFWAAWCGPCKAVAPILEELAGEHAGKLKIAKIDIDENEQITAEFNVRSIPTLILFKGGAEAERIVGFQPKAALKSRLTPYLH